VADCTVCGRETTVTAACPHCAGPVCEEHRQPPAHDCPGVDGDATAGWYTDPEAGGTGDSTGGAARGPDGGADRDGDADRDDAVHVRPVSDPRRVATGVLLVVLLAVVGVGALAAAGPPAADVDERTVEREAAAAVNDERTQRGLDPLRTDEALASVARAHSEDMLERDYFDHVSPDGATVGDRYERAGLDCYGGENIYTGSNADLFVSERAIADGVVSSLMASPGHRDDILEESYEAQGIGVAIGPEGRIYVTQDFC
jgi:uncharacterized protein YkwD